MFALILYVWLILSSISAVVLLVACVRSTQFGRQIKQENGLTTRTPHNMSFCTHRSKLQKEPSFPFAL